MTETVDIPESTIHHYLYLQIKESKTDKGTTLVVTGDGELLLDGRPCSDEEFLTTLRLMAVAWKKAVIAEKMERSTFSGSVEIEEKIQ